MYTAIERGGKKVKRTYFTTGAIMILRKILKWMIAGESIVISMLLLWILYQIVNAKHTTVQFQEASPDGSYVLCIEELGSPTPVLYPMDRIRIRFRESDEKEECHSVTHSVTFRVNVPTKGDKADCNVEWLDDGVRIVLSGTESQYYVLPFVTLGE